MSAGLIAAGASLLGGLFDRGQRNKELGQQQPDYIRKAFEDAGFNPLLGIGNALQGLNYAPQMGQSIANAGALYAEGMNKEKQLELQRSQLDIDNRRLTAQIKNMTLNRKVGGIYSGKGSAATPKAAPLTAKDVLPPTEAIVEAATYVPGVVKVDENTVGDTGKAMWHNWNTSAGNILSFPFEDLEWDSIAGGTLMATYGAGYDRFEKVATSEAYDKHLKNRQAFITGKYAREKDGMFEQSISEKTKDWPTPSEVLRDGMKNFSKVWPAFKPKF